MNTALGYYVATIAVYFFVYVILELGYNLQYGLTGIRNVGNYVFTAFGAYIGGVLSLGPASTTLQTYILGATLPYPLPLVLGGVAGAVVAAALGFLFLYRLRAQYQAIVTLVVAQVAWLVVGNWVPLFNGYNGLAGVPQPLASTLGLPPVEYQFVFAAMSGVVALVCFGFMQRLARSPFGRMLRAIREDDTVAATFGKNVFGVQMTALVLSGFMAGLAGALQIEFLGAWSPSTWSVPEGFVVIAALIIGGTGNNWGAALGGFILPVGIYELTVLIPAFNSPGVGSTVIPALRWILIGLLALAFLWFRPQGMIPEPKPAFPPRAVSIGTPDATEGAEVVS